MSQILPPYALGNEQPSPNYPRTPLVWAYELQAQRDELLRLLRNLTGLAATRGHLHEYSAAVKEAQEYIAKVEATK